MTYTTGSLIEALGDSLSVNVRELAGEHTAHIRWDLRMPTGVTIGGPLHSTASFGSEEEALAAAELHLATETEAVEQDFHRQYNQLRPIGLNL